MAGRRLRSSLLGVDPESVYQREGGAAVPGPPGSDVTGYDPGAFGAFASLLGTITGVPGLGQGLGMAAQYGYDQGALPGLTMTDPSTGARGPATVATRLGDYISGLPPVLAQLPYDVVPQSLMRWPQGERLRGTDEETATPFGVNLTDALASMNAPPAQGGPAGQGLSEPSGIGPGTGTSPTGETMHEGGVVKDRSTAPKLAETITAQQGEFVVRRPSSKKYRRLLEAINADDGPRVMALAMQHGMQDAAVGS